MKTLGVCIVLDNNNFGSMLQSYATQEYLRIKKIDFVLLKYKKEKNLRLFMRLLNPVMWSDKLILVKRKFAILQYPELKACSEQRIKSFNRFRDKYFHKSDKLCRGYQELCEAGAEFEAYMVGSDQLWSPSGLETNFYNLMFVDETKYKFSYAASFGVSKIADKQLEATSEYLRRIDSISVRENSGAVIVKELTGRDIPVVVDPTLLFDSQGWDNNLNPRQIIKGKYILVYFLGDNPEYRNAVKELAKVTGLKIVLIPMERLHKTNIGLADQESYSWGPDDFVSLIKYADYICTDSFHGMVFSSIYHKKFIVFNRYEDNAIDSKNTRIDSFCETYGLKYRRYHKDTFIADMLQDIDYNDIDAKMKEKRRMSQDFFDGELEKI